MSTSTVSIRTLPVLVSNSFSLASAPSPSLPALRPLDRVPNRTEAAALQRLAHAIEYLADMRIWDASGGAADAEAMRVLLHCSRQVFQACAPKQSLLARLAAMLPSRR